MTDKAQQVTNEVLAVSTQSGNPRMDAIMASLIKHLHGFVQEIKPTDAEWEHAIDFLTRTGHTCSGMRQEFILLSDVLGVSSLKDVLNHVAPDGATDSAVLGPFYRDGANVLENGANISMREEDGEPCLVEGVVTDPAGNPIAGALLDVWQNASNGLYEQQDSNQPEMNLRGVFKTDAQGRYHFRTVKPKHYPIPKDGPVGELLNATARHNFRPAHIHFIVTAEGYESLTTQYFDKDSDYIESDAVFGVKGSLLTHFIPLAEASPENATELPENAWYATCNFGMTPA